MVMSMANHAGKLARKLVTPEGVKINITLGDMGARAGAFVVDIIVMIVLLFLSIYVAGKIFDLGSDDGVRGGIIFFLIALFLLRNGYFLLFEASKRAATPGKMLLKLRVVSRDGGPLTLNQVVARNMMRELEIFAPLSMLAMQSAESPGSVGGFGYLVGFLWTLIFMLFPLFNRDNLRVGDLLAGTWVLSVRKNRIQEDLTEHNFAVLKDYHFTREQLAVYGVFELQKLEEVMRRADPQVMADVADSIGAKIGWPEYIREPHAFLLAYYQALRPHLERGVLMGNRKENKYSA